MFFFGKEEYFIWASVSDAMPGAGAAQEKKRAMATQTKRGLVNVSKTRLR